MLYDDREASAGEKFADAELLGVPLRLTVGKRSVEAGELEVQVRRGQEKRTLPLEGAAQRGRGAVARPPLSRRRLLGLDRSGPPPPATRAGEPLRPWTLPNAIGFMRLALIPVFLVIALDSGDGRDATASLLYAVIGGTDYLDGMAARLTGQYSRLGTLLDPLTDRLLVVAGVVVTWHFELLPRWALAVLAARELVMLLLTRAALRRGIELKVNMIGPLGCLADDVLDLPGDGLGHLGGRGAALRRPGHDAVGHRALFS